MGAGKQYSALYASSSSAGSGVAFGFTATMVTVFSTAGINYIDFTTTSGVTTTTGFQLGSTDAAFTITAREGGYTGLSVTTSSGAAALRILALR